jgi:aerobic-type carbon monoxide dehydrogenase small subunit (CoxS/CutS family)
MPAASRISLRVNGRAFAREIESRRHLADLLRHDLGLTGTHIGCEHGACGACTVLLDGMPVRSCLMFAVQAADAEVTTVEGLAGNGERLHPLQAAFRNHHGLQCGFCTPGMLMTLLAFLNEHPDAEESAIRDAISGNLCRCTGYETIIDAALEAASAMRKAPP